ncbi:MAG: formate/nitrite transporter family protein [Rhodospirillales bacterium]|nr:formate/nitrite transporter family protein [Rhodospirillales bacterium]
MAEDQNTESNNSNSGVFDAYIPAQIARRIEVMGISKASLPAIPLLTLSILAGAFIALGAMFYTVVVTDTGLGLGPTRLLGGLAFSLGLVLVIVGGAELFTGNSLIVMGWAHGKVRFSGMMRNWAFAYVGNLMGAVGMAVLAFWSGYLHMGDDAVATTVIKIAVGKTQLPFDVAFVRGLLCNVLVCLAVWLCFAAHTVTSKILAIIFPISAFVTLGFEHSIANMFFIPLGMLAAGDPTLLAASGIDAAMSPTLAGFVANIVPVTLGNIVGGGVFVALSYYMVYLYGRD